MSYMGLFNWIQKAIDVLTEDDSIEKGNEFEKTDNTRQHDRFVEADMGPDLKMRYIRTDEAFYVECKFRSGLYDDKLEI